MNLTTNSQRLLSEMVKQEFEDNVTYSDASQFFEFFTARQIMKNAELSDEEIERGVLGSGNDGGCDAVYTLFNNVIISEDTIDDIITKKDSNIDLVIIQAKQETSFGENALMKWKTSTGNLLEIGVENKQYEKRYNEDVITAFALFRDLYVKVLRNTPKLNISFYYATYAVEVHPNVQAQANELETMVRKLFPSNKTTVKVFFWGAEELLLAAQSQAEHKISLPLAESPINTGNHKDFVALVNITKYYNFITDENGNLRKYIFEANVRDYQGHNAVNQDIENTLATPSGEDFWWLNNGITLLTDEAILATNKELVLTEPAVVNGLQTSNEIYRFFQENPEKLANETRNILVRVIVPESEDSRDRIILATNNQTNIPKSSLRANDPIHWQIELFLKGRGLYYDRRKNYYKNQGKKSNEIVSVSFLAQCMISLLLQKPNYARARPSTLLTKDETYNELYLNNPNLDVFYNAAKLGKTIDIYLKKSNQYTPSQKNDIVFYVLYYAVAKAINKSTITFDDVKNINLNFFSEKYILEAAQEVFEVYNSLGGNGRIAKGTEMLTAILARIPEKAENSEKGNIT